MIITINLDIYLEYHFLIIYDKISQTLKSQLVLRD